MFVKPNAKLKIILLPIWLVFGGNIYFKCKVIELTYLLRGLEISAGYLKGEWKLDFAATNVTLYDPSSAVV